MRPSLIQCVECAKVAPISQEDVAVLVPAGTFGRMSFADASQRQAVCLRALNSRCFTTVLRERAVARTSGAVGPRENETVRTLWGRGLSVEFGVANRLTPLADVRQVARLRPLGL